jgi:hypothetical protein
MRQQFFKTPPQHPAHHQLMANQQHPAQQPQPKLNQHPAQQHQHHIMINVNELQGVTSHE